MNNDRLMQIILAPIVTEKATMVAEQNNQVAFRVIADATKPEVKAAVELLFKVEVERFGRFMGRRRHERKAYVSLKDGQEINLAEVN